MPFSEYLAKHAENSVMIFGFYDYKIIQKKSNQCRDKIKYLYDFHFTSMNKKRLKWDKDEAEDRLSDFNRTYDMFKDEKSKRTMELYLRAAVNGEFDELYKECYEETAYFNDITCSFAVETLIDCGAFDGDSIHDFVSVFTNYKDIYAIEPDLFNRNKLANRINNEKIRDVIVIPKGVYKESATLYFSSDGSSASHMDENGDISVSVIALDEFLAENDNRLLIKMDIEGSEMDALIGARKTILSKNPCLAVCVYHKETDLIYIPQYIDSLVDKGTYDYYLRFHGLDLSELVFYAVPRK